MMKRALLIACLWANANLMAVSAETKSPNSPTKQNTYEQGQDIQDPARLDNLVRNGIHRLNTFLIQEEVLEVESIRDYLLDQIAPHFDFNAMGRWAAGPFYPQLTDGQKIRFSTKLETLFFDALARNLGAYSRPLPKIQIYPTPFTRHSKQRIVRARVMPDRGYPINVDFRFASRHGEWKIYDISANGFSAAAYYRQHFARLAREKGKGIFYE